jgi:hypothetical protein
MSAEVRRLKSLVVISLIVPLLGSEVTWAFVLEALADGSHHVSLRSSNGHVDIVLQHGADSHPEAGHLHVTDDGSDVQAVAIPDSHDHRDHVVKLPGSERVPTNATKLSQPHCGSAIVVAAAIDCSSIHVPRVSFVACSRVGPAAPSRSSILRI